MRGGSRLLVAALALLGSACAHRGGDPTDSPSNAAADAVRVYVTNNFTLQMNVYAEAGGSSYRMGLVAPGIASQFVLRESMVGSGPVEFWAQPNAGGPIVRSGRLSLFAGAIVDFEIAARLNFSRATIRP